MRDQVTCDSFLNALGDPELAFKIRERQPADLDSALHIALQLEAWTKELKKHRNTSKLETGNSRRTRKISAKKPDPTVNALWKEMENVKRFIGFEQGAPRSPDDGTYASNYDAPGTYDGPAVPTSPFRWRSVSYGNWAKFGHPSDGYGSRNSNFYQDPNSNPGCFRCGNLKHRVRNCPVSSAKHRRPAQRQTIPLQPPAPQQPDVTPAGNQQSELFQVRRVLTRISDSVAAFRKEVEKKFVKLEQRIPKVDDTNHTHDFDRLSSCRRIS